MVIFDTSVLVLALDPDAKPPIDRGTGKPLTKAKERVNFLIATLSKAETTILIPTPVLGEYLVKAGRNKQDFIDKFFASKNFDVASFDTKAAIEIAFLIDPDLLKKELDDKTTKAKLKFDRQIVAIGKAQRVARIYTGDEGLKDCAVKNGIAVTLTWELPEPPLPPNYGLFNGQDAK